MLCGFIGELNAANAQQEQDVTFENKTETNFVLDIVSPINHSVLAYINFNRDSTVKRTSTRPEFLAEGSIIEGTYQVPGFTTRSEFRHNIQWKDDKDNLKIDRLIGDKLLTYQINFQRTKVDGKYAFFVTIEQSVTENPNKNK